MTLFTITLMLILIIDPFGNLSTFLNLLRHVDPRRQRFIICREMLIALTAMLAFNYLGHLFLETLHIGRATVNIASGAILFLISIKILFPNTNSLRYQLQKGLESNEEPFVVPLAIPLIAGPSLLATIILYSQLEPCKSLMLGAILLAWLFSSIVLFFGSSIKRILTTNGLVACERLMGMILVLLAIQRFLEGIQLFVASCQI